MSEATIESPSALATPRASLYRAVWRWHFYAGLFTMPFLVMLAATGLIMLWVGVLDGRDGERSVSVRVGTGAVQAVSAQAEAAVQAVPGGKLVQYLAPSDPERPALFRVDGADGPQIVAVNPYTAEVLRNWPHRAGWYDLADRIHGTLLLGTVGDRLIEIAAGFGVMLVVTGLYLWWPRGRGGVGRMLVPNLAQRGRPLIKSLHGTAGFYVSLLLLVFLVSGMSWTGVWGERFTQAWSTFPAAKWDNVPLSEDVHASMNHGAAKEMPWGLEQTPMPMSGSPAGTHAIAEGTPVTIDSVVAFARSQGFGAEGRFQVNAPKNAGGVWTVSQDTMSNDTRNPTGDRTVHIDQYSGRLLADVRFGDYAPAAKAMAVGVAFHEGDLGWWNVALNTLLCLSVIFVAISGAVMWWLRRPEGAMRLGAPPMPENVPLVRGMVLLMLLLALLFPLVGLTLLAVLALDLLVVSRIPVLRRALA